MPPQDALFLLGESEQNPTHVTALQILRPPPGAGPEFVDHLYSVLTDPSDLKSAFTRRPAQSWSTGGAPSWRPAENLDLTAHVRRVTLPAPGRVRELLEHVSRRHAGMLPRDRPLWEADLIEGLEGPVAEGGRLALLTKLHHAMFDGITLAKHMSSGLSVDPEARGCVAPWTRPPGTPRRAARSDGQSVLDTAGDLVREAASSVAGVVGGLPALGAALNDVLSGDLGIAFSAPHTRLNARLSERRRFAGDAWSRERLAAIGERTGATINDVGLAMCAGALRRYLAERDELPEVSLVAMVPVALREPGDSGRDQGNAWGSVYCVLGTDLDEPLARLGRIQASMSTGKATLRSLDPATVVAVNVVSMGLAALPTLRMVPPPPRPVVNLIISNVPASKQTLYFDGAEVTDNYPVSMVCDGQALNITMVPYVDSVAFGLTGCPEAVPGLQHLLGHLDAALAELEVAAGG